VRTLLYEYLSVELGRLLGHVSSDPSVLSAILEEDLIPSLAITSKVIT
jgi:hypothetical protein